MLLALCRVAEARGVVDGAARSSAGAPLAAGAPSVAAAGEEAGRLLDGAAAGLAAGAPSTLLVDAADFDNDDDAESGPEGEGAVAGEGADEDGGMEEDYGAEVGIYGLRTRDEGGQIKIKEIMIEKGGGSKIACFFSLKRAGPRTCGRSVEVLI